MIAPKSVESEKERIRKALETPPSPQPQDDNTLVPSVAGQSSPDASPRTRKKSLLDMIPSAFHAARTLRGASKNDGRSWRAPEVRFRPYLYNLNDLALSIKMRFTHSSLLYAAL